MATPNYGNEPRTAPNRWWWCATRLLVAASLTMGVAADLPQAGAFAARALRVFEQARQQHQLQPEAPTAAWQFARACFDWAEFATNDTQRAAIAEEGIAVSRRLVREQPHLAPAHYYLAMNLGQLARTKSVGALPLVSEMERVFKRTHELDAHFDYAGPDRCLGLLYRDAPGWPVSLGSKRKARTHLKRAFDLSPAFPENRLNLIESLLEWGDESEFTAWFRETGEALDEARPRLVGEDWAVSWADWDRRWTIVQAKARRIKGDAAETGKPR